EVKDLVVEDGLGVERVKRVSFTVRRGGNGGAAGGAGHGPSQPPPAPAGIRPGEARGDAPHQAPPVAAAAPPPPRPPPPGSPPPLRRLGLAHVPEDRHRMGLVIPFVAQESAILGYHGESTYNGPIRLHRSAVASSFERQVAEYDIRPGNGVLPTSAFSGGN